MLHILNDREQLCQQYLNILFKNTVGHSARARDKKTIAQTYGEILFPSVAKLLMAISLTSHDIFFDAGSGLGKLALQVFLSSSVKSVYGIEIIPELHQQALLVAQKFQEDLPECYLEERSLHFILGNFLEVPFDKATVVFIGSPCFTPSMLDNLGKKLENTPSIHTVLSLRPLNLLQRLPFKRVLRLQGSWDTTLCYVYSQS